MLKTLKEYLKQNKKEIDEIKLYFKKCAVEIDRSNLYMLRRSCMYTSIVFVCMLFFAVTCIPGFNVTLGHILMAVMLIAYFFINALIRKRGSISTVQTATVCLFFYFLVGMSFILIEMLSYITDHTRWLPLLLMIFPVLFIDRLYKYVIEELFLIAVYAAISWFFKDPIMFSRDFNHIPVLAVCSGEESRKLAVKMGADRVMSAEDPQDLIKNNIGELGGI